ncbi:hypothetical protein [Erysipelothrix piscisicarius]|uniref:hypothetical protein n=1 Tax=Erysipelothrix piscisicarius TaxID=2485784 RepID=UPI001E640BAC|nr:hypothetical protein [Erysipelothrix piscisicarius]
MNKRKSIQIGIVVIVFILLDIWFGNTYHYMDIGSMLYLSTFILVIAEYCLSTVKTIKVL